MASEYTEIPSTPHVAIDTDVRSDEDDDEKKLAPLPAYDPTSWRETLFVIKGRPFVEEGTRKPLFVLWGIGVALVILSALVGVTLEENDRKCRAWCSQFSLGPQPHTYIGVILFLLMAFRSNQSYHSYEVGLTAWTTIRREILAFTSTMLSATPRDSIKREERLRMLSFAAAFPYFLFADLNEERIFPDGSVELLLKPKDLRHARGASSMPMYCIQELMSMIALYSTDAVSANVKKAMNQAVHNLIAPFTEAERIKSNPVAFAYIAHLRLLLCIYLAALPLALVESLGWSTIPVFMVISYALLSLEVIAVEIQDPFGKQANDLRIMDFNLEIHDLVGEMWRRWVSNRPGEPAKAYADGFGVRNNLSFTGGRYKSW